MRGKARKRPTGKRLEGITPAYAGKRRTPEFLHVDT